jgi:hypothetical protein
VNDIELAFGSLPLVALSREDVTLWVNAIFDEGASGETITNKHRFLSGALNAAVTAAHITANPCRGMRLPRWDRRETVVVVGVLFSWSAT